MTEQEIVDTLKIRLKDKLRQSEISPYESKAFPCVTESLVREAEAKLGYVLPPLLSRIWIEVANGGTGPGYGLYGLDGGLPDEGTELTIPELCLHYRELSYWEEIVGESLSQTTFPICDWGCRITSILDCSTPAGKIFLLSESGLLVDQNASFAEWIEDWLIGKPVGSESYKRASGVVSENAARA